MFEVALLMFSIFGVITIVNFLILLKLISSMSYMEDLFKKFDTDSDNRISIEEHTSGFANLDKDGDKFLDFDEFKKQFNDEKLYKLWMKSKKSA